MSLVTSCVGLQEEPQTAHPTASTWASYIAASVLTGHQTHSLTHSIHQHIAVGIVEIVLKMCYARHFSLSNHTIDSAEHEKSYIMDVQTWNLVR